MTDAAHETLFQEHWRRFFDLPQQAGPIETAIAEALFWNDQMAWSLGIIPWHAWRYPFQKAMLGYLHECCPQAQESTYELINTALATAHGDYLALPSDADKESLIDTVHSFCSSAIATRAINQLHNIRRNPPLLRLPFLEGLWQRLSKRRKLKRQGEFVAYLSYFLHFRIINNFLKRCQKSLCRDEDRELRDIIALSTVDILLNVPLQAPHFFTEKRLAADTSKMSPEIYNFWSWQYTYRNAEYQALRKPLGKFFRSTGIIFPNTPISNHKEYEIAYKRTVGEYNVFGMIFPEYDLSINSTIENFDYYPAWPITGYTSDFILRRMLSGEFKYWERETPPPKISREKEIHLCLRNPTHCDNENRITVSATDGQQHFEVCSPECIIAMQSQEQELYQEIVNEDRSRIRPEPIRRMIGLWLWDYCYGHNVKKADAIRALKAAHFPEKNPNWDADKISNSKGEDWYTYRERATEKHVLYADFDDADRCIKEAKFLPRQRGVKKPVKPKSTKGKIKK